MPPIRTSINREAHSYRPGERPRELDGPAIGDYAARGEKAAYHVTVADMAQGPAACVPIHLAWPVDAHIGSLFVRGALSVGSAVRWGRAVVLSDPSQRKKSKTKKHSMIKF